MTIPDPPTTPTERSALIRELVAEHESIIQERGYPFAVAWELRKAMYEYVSKWVF